MEKPPTNNPTPKIEAQKNEQILFSEQEKNIQEVFKLCPKLKSVASESLGLNPDYNGIKIELGRNKKVSYGTVQNIKLQYNDESIVDDTSEDWKNDRAKIVAVDMGSEIVVGNIVFPENIRGKGLVKYVYQAIADKLGKPVVDSLKHQKEIGVGYGQSEPGSMLWKTREAFNPYELKPEQEQKTLQLYQEYLKAIFPESKVQEILFHTTSATFENFDKEYISRGNVSFGEGFYFTDKIDNHKDFKGGDKTVPVVINVDRVYKDSVEEKDRREKPKYNPYVNSHERLLEVQKQHNEFLEKNFDGVIATYNNKNEFVVFEPENIHILGSKIDVEKFKEFVSKSSTPEVSPTTTPDSKIIEFLA